MARLSRFSSVEKQRICQEWFESGLPQEEFCTLPHVGLNPRTLRRWLVSHSFRRPNPESIMQTIYRAARELRAHALALEASLDGIIPPKPITVTPRREPVTRLVNQPKLLEPLPLATPTHIETPKAPEKPASFDFDADD